MRRTCCYLSDCEMEGVGERGATNLFGRFGHGIDARGDAGKVFGQLFCALGIYLHVGGHGRGGRWAEVGG